MANSGLPCLPELSGLGDFTDSEMSAHAKRSVRKHAFLYVNTPFGLSLWRREVFKLFFEWQLLSYCIIFKDSFDRFNKWVAYDTLLKSLIKHNAVKTISSPFLITHFPWCFLHQFFHCTYMSISLCVLSISHFNHSHECIFTFHIELRWGKYQCWVITVTCNPDNITRFQKMKYL